jgi:hypothetical protein
MLASYLNFDLRLFDHEDLPDGSERLRVQVADSPIGELAEAEAVMLPAGLRARLGALERRELDWPAMVAFGRDIAAALLPPAARACFQMSMARLAPSQGLRLRLRCESVELDALPWEMAHVSFGASAGAADRRDFLVLNTRLSMVRREVCVQLLNPAQRQGASRRLVALMCEPTDRRDPARPLEVERELEQLRDALSAVDGVELAPCGPGTRQALADLLTAGADVFHFAGHGEFRADAPAGAQACLLLQHADGTTDRWPTAEMALRLANKGIQLAVLGACRSAQRDGRSAWAGIAPSLARAGIPAVIGMQYTVFDASALAFSRRLYYNWSRGASLDQAVAEARIEICDVQGDTGRDFATPVLYLREDGLKVQAGSPAVMPPPLVAAVPDAAPAPDGLSPVVALLAELYDYKRVHDALHSVRTREFNLILLRRGEFPGGSTVREFTSLARELRKRLQDLRRVAGDGRCDEALMAAIVEEFDATLVTLDEAVNGRSADALEDAIAAFESLLSTQPVRVDTWMSSLAQRLEIERMVQYLRALPLSRQLTAAAIDELHELGDQLRRHAMLHSQCQALDNCLAVVRKTPEADRFRELRRQQRPLTVQLGKLLPLWSAADVDKLRECGERLAQSVAAQDEAGARDAFDALCDDFDYGFYTVDADFKQLCNRMIEQAEAQLPIRRATG